ncbi:MAG: LysR family transcriptional regulator [Kangiellaceae bacterium]|nr:LysR family transcriptional regulator [Kangiellaceae bacterium]MCW8998902.1 LysR family transcriptional regulator [Kangiellaceae bacterium]
MANTLRFELYDLKLFVAAVESGSISKAAEQLPLALSAASARIKTLEDRLGSQLLLRGARGVKVTTAGKLFYDHALRMLRVAGDAQRGMDALAGKGREKLRLWSNTTGLSTRLPRQLAEYLEMNPELDIEFEQHSSREVLKAVNSGAADLGIVDGDYSQRDLLYLLYQRNQLVVIAHPQNELAQHSSCKFIDWLAQPLVGYESESSLQQFIERMALIAHLPANFRVKVPNFSSVAKMVSQGIGVAIVPMPLAKQYEPQYDIRTIELAETWANRELHVCVQPNENTSLPAIKLARYLARIE